RVACGRLHRVHRGVYAVGHPLETPASAYMSAVLACGPGALLSHRSAAAHWGFYQCRRGQVDVSAESQRGRHLPGIDAHCSRTLAPADATTVRDIPCTSVARTLLDFAEVVGLRATERAVEEAERLRLFDGHKARDLLARANGRRGAAVLAAILDGYEEPPLTQLELERRLFELCESAGIERPQTQVQIALSGGDIVFADFLWPESELIVETDGRGTHGTRQAFERDRRRDRRLMMLGYRVARFTWLDVVQRPDEVARTILALSAQEPEARE
ncbi:MAG: DUF559 domain-containing protein, partial [Actinomycetota bacterium]|nr:DUF559 domain-containing protein [Actinomycetota bacterium]